MARIADFHCTYDHASGFGTWAAETYGISFPKAYMECDEMVKLALAVKDHNQTTMCQLPFCHTLEAEVLGGIVKIGDGVTGPRCGGYICKSLEEVPKFPDVSGLQARCGDSLELTESEIKTDDNQRRENTKDVGCIDPCTDRLWETLSACRKLKEKGETVVAVIYKKKEVRFAGQDCMNHVGHVLADGKLKELVLI